MLLPRFYLLFTFLVFVHCSYAQDRRNLSFEHLGIEHGLSQGFVRAIYKDSRGFMWFGTANDGLNKYDGYDFTVYRNDPDDKRSLCSNHINQIAEDAKGNIWIATENGLARFDRNTENFTSYSHNPSDSNSLSDRSVQSVLEDDEGIIWVGTAVSSDKLGGLNAFDPKTNTFSHYLPGTDVKTIIQDENGDLWIGSVDQGLFFFDKKEKSFINFQHDENDPISISSNSIYRLFQDGKKNIWIASREGGLNKFDPKNNSFKQYRKGPDSTRDLSSDAVLSITEDKEGFIWIGMENGGLCLLDPVSNEVFRYSTEINDPSGISSNSIHALYSDKMGNVWVGSLGGGLDLFQSDNNKFQFYREGAAGKGLNHYGVLAIREDSKGNLLIGTDGGGVNILNKKTGTFSYLKNIPGNENSISGDHILSILEDSDHNLWIGTWGDGATLYNREKNTYKHFKHNPNDITSIGSNNAWTIFEDSEKNIWIGTYWGGLNLYDKNTGTFRQFKKDNNNPDGIGSNDVSAIHEDKKGNIWLGTYNGGLEMLDKKNFTFKRFQRSADKNSISSDIVFSIYEDKNNDFWMGTLSGLNHFNTKTNQFTVYTSKDGLPHDLIRAVTADDEGNIWLSTSKGLSKMNVKDKTFKNFVNADGLRVSEFTDAMLKSKSGKLYFGGNKGFVGFDPHEIRESKIEPPIKLTNFLIFNNKVPISDSLNNSPLKKHISETDSITLSYKHSVVTFEFAALVYTGERTKQYAYMLEGFDDKWNEIGIKRSATYTNLDPGQYVLKVRTLINEGNWSKQNTTLHITITPPFWKTWWFRTLTVLFGMGIAFVVYSIRVSSIKRQKVHLEKEVIARTLQLKSANDEKDKLYLEIKDSIRAAQEVQEAILPEVREIRRYLKDFFVFYKPKDIVSGDFYWFQEKDDKLIIAAVDCTGHGVSGALMSINGYYLLKSAINENNHLVASEILERLNEGVTKEMKGNNFESMSGMDISLCVVDLANKTLQYAGANAPLYIVSQGDLIETKADRYSIGQTYSNDRKVKYNNNSIHLQENDWIFMFTDGIRDQFGGDRGDEKFSSVRLRHLLKDITVNGDEPVQILEKSLKEWMGTIEQLDDIMVLGFKI